MTQADEDDTDQPSDAILGAVGMTRAGSGLGETLARELQGALLDTGSGFYRVLGEPLYVPYEGMIDIGLSASSHPPQFVSRFESSASNDYFCMRSFVDININDRWLTNFAAPLIQATTGVIPGVGLLQCQKTSLVAIELCGRLRSTPQLTHTNEAGGEWQDGQRVVFQVVGDPKVIVDNTYSALRPLCHAAVDVAEDEIRSTLSAAAEGVFSAEIQSRLRVFNYIVGAEAVAGTPAEIFYRVPNRVTLCSTLESRIRSVDTIEEAIVVIQNLNDDCAQFAPGPDAQCEWNPSGSGSTSTSDDGQYGCAYHVPVSHIEMLPSGMEFTFARDPDDPFFEKFGSILGIAGIRPSVCGRPDGDEGLSDEESPSRDPASTVDGPMFSFFSGGVTLVSEAP